MFSSRPACSAPGLQLFTCIFNFCTVCLALVHHVMLWTYMINPWYASSDFCKICFFSSWSLYLWSVRGMPVQLLALAVQLLVCLVNSWDYYSVSGLPVLPMVCLFSSWTVCSADRLIFTSLTICSPCWVAFWATDLPILLWNIRPWYPDLISRLWPA